MDGEWAACVPTKPVELQLEEGTLVVVAYERDGEDRDARSDSSSIVHGVAACLPVTAAGTGQSARVR